MKRTFYAHCLLLSLLILSAGGLTEVSAQNNIGIAKTSVNVKAIVDLTTQRKLSEQIDDFHCMPEHERPIPHPAATDRVHYPKIYKDLQGAQGSGRASPAPLIGFASKSYDGYYPPDPHGAVSENYVVGTVNDELYIQDRSGNLIADVKLKNFWAPVHITTQLFDPRLTYDFTTHTWMLVTAAYPFADSSSILIAVSQTEDPTGIWDLYKIIADSAGSMWADYPNIAFNKKWIAVTVNLFYDTSGNSNTGRVYLLDRAQLSNGTLSSVKSFDTDQGVIAAVTYDRDMDDLYLMETYAEQAGQLQMLKISGSAGSETIASVGYPALQMPWSPASDQTESDFAPQLGDSNKIQCNDDRMGSVVVKNNTIWCAHTVFLPADAPTRASVLWWALDTNGDVLQHCLIDDPSSNTFYAFPSIAVNKFNDALIAYSVFDKHLYPSAAYSYHDHAQAAGMVNDSYIFKNGQNSYHLSGGGRNRWGDCSAVLTDPLNDIDFWAIGEYAETNANTWGTWWTNIGGLDTFNHDPVSIDIAPNPNNGDFNIYIVGQIHTAVVIDIYDLLGRHIYTTTSDSRIIVVGIHTLHGYLADGIYIVRAMVNGQTLDRKIVVR